jgi:uncharacterized membrane protein
MEELFKEVASYVALAVEAAAVLIIAYGAMEALIRLPRPIFQGEQRAAGERKHIWLRFAVWLLLGLEFELAADIIRSVITPTWADIGKLGAIAVIRTFLNYFLEKDLKEYGEGSSAARAGVE